MLEPVHEIYEKNPGRLISPEEDNTKDVDVAGEESIEAAVERFLREAHVIDPQPHGRRPDPALEAARAQIDAEARARLEREVQEQIEAEFERKLEAARKRAATAPQTPPEPNAPAAEELGSVARSSGKRRAGMYLLGAVLVAAAILYSFAAQEAMWHNPF